MEPGSTVKGPSILIDDISTILVEPDCNAMMNDEGNIVIDVLGTGEDDPSLNKDDV